MVEASMTTTTAKEQTSSGDPANTSAAPSALELSPPWLARDPDESLSAEKPRKKTRAVHSSEEENDMEDDDPPIAAPPPGNLQELATYDPSDGLIVESKAGRLRWWKRTGPARRPAGTTRLTAVLMMMICAHPAANECMNPGHVWLPPWGVTKDATRANVHVHHRHALHPFLEICHGALEPPVCRSCCVEQQSIQYSCCTDGCSRHWPCSSAQTVQIHRRSPASREVQLPRWRGGTNACRVGRNSFSQMGSHPSFLIGKLCRSAFSLILARSFKRE